MKKKNFSLDNQCEVVEELVSSECPLNDKHSNCREKEMLILILHGNKFKEFNHEYYSADYSMTSCQRRQRSAGTKY